MQAFSVQRCVGWAKRVVGVDDVARDAVVALLLLVISIVEGFAAIGLLFLVLYPLLPSKLGYVKAASLAVYLSLIFAAGVGADDRLLSGLLPLTISRFIYYLSVPLLLGLFIDIVSTGAPKRVPGVPPTLPASFQASATLFFKDARGVLSSVAAIVSVVAPGVYTLITGTPVVGTYFNLLDVLLRFP